ncbi:MAG: efflux RND transporter permease subunit [Bacillota bacterium]
MISKIATSRPVTTVMITLMSLMAGILAYTNMDLALMPDVDIPMALVSTVYVGAGPEEIENLISVPLEEALGSVTNIDTVTSISGENSSMVILQFVDGTDLDMATVDVREILDRVKTSLPEDANEPTILKIDLNATQIALGVTSKTLDLNQMNTLVEENITPRLERMEGVASVSVSGGMESEIRLTVDPNKLSLYGLSISTLSQMLQAENMNLPLGDMSYGDTNVNIRVVGQFTSLNDLRALPLMTPTGAMIQLEDVALVEEVEKARTSATYINGTPGILINVDKQSTANLVRVSEDIQEQLVTLNANNPEINLLLLSDTSDYITASISNVTNTALLSAVIAFFILLIFLKNPVTSAIIAVSIPTSIFIAFAMMYLTKMSLNTISMGGIAIGIGMLVDNSIVVLDSIYYYYEQEYSPKDAAILGAKEVTMAITASTLTTVAVFLPMAFVGGTIGGMLSNLSFSVTYALVASLVVSITFVPMASALLLQKDHGKPSGRNIFSLIGFLWDKILFAVEFGYGIIIKIALNCKILTVALMIYIFVQTLSFIPLIGVDFMAATDEGVVSVSIKMPSGTNFDKTEEVALEALYRLESLPEMELMHCTVSTGSASITLNLVPKDERERSTADISLAINTMFEDLPGAEITASASSMAMGDMSSSGVSFNIYGYENSELMALEKEIIAMMETHEEFSNVTGSTGTTIPEARVVIDREKASSYGIYTSSIASALNTAISGSTATQYKVGGTELDVVLRYEQSGVTYLSQLDTLMVDTQSGAKVPLSEVANIEISESSTQVTRENQKNMVTISADVNGMSSNEAKNVLIEILDNYSFPEGYTYGFSGSVEMMTDAMVSLGICMVVAVLLVYMIMASQFESLGAPFIVMFSMPLAITGGIVGLYITGNTITMPAMMGFVMLIGIVVNNAIVLIDYANQLMEQEGISCYEALLLAGPRRIRPILMTSLTTILGMVPLAISEAEGSEMMKALAIGVIFGLMFSTVVTLVLIPVLFLWLNNFADFFKRGKEKRRTKRLAKWARINEKRAEREKKRLEKKTGHKAVEQVEETVENAEEVVAVDAEQTVESLTKKIDDLTEKLEKLEKMTGMVVVNTEENTEENTEKVPEKTVELAKEEGIDQELKLEEKETDETEKE